MSFVTDAVGLVALGFHGVVLGSIIYTWADRYLYDRMFEYEAVYPHGVKPIH